MLHPIQRAMVENHAFQCAPSAAFLSLTIRCLLDDCAGTLGSEIPQELSGNLCRCTGYRGIVDSVEALVAGFTSGK